MVGQQAWHDKRKHKIASVDRENNQCEYFEIVDKVLVPKLASSPSLWLLLQMMNDHSDYCKL